MGDPKLRDFYGRITRIEQARSKGHGFEAPGTPGLSHHPRRAAARRRPILGPVFIAVVMALGLKGAIHCAVGAAPYDHRVDSLLQGKGLDRLGGWLMRADPASLWVSGVIRKMVG